MGPTKPQPTVCTTAIAELVSKEGRLTIPPYRVLEACRLLPPKSADEPSPGRTLLSMLDGHTSIPDGISLEPAMTSFAPGATVQAAIELSTTTLSSVWLTWGFMIDKDNALAVS